MSRASRASEALTEMMAGGYDERRILVGPGAPESEICDRIDTDPLLETRLDSIASCLADDFGLTLPKGRITEETCKGVLAVALRHTLDRGQVLHERSDGITFHACPSPDTPGWVIAQVSVSRDGGEPEVAGIYYHTSLLVLEGFRGRGIAADLVVEHVLENGGVLNWELDTCAYSPGGEAAHLAALRKIQALASEAAASPSP